MKRQKILIFLTALTIVSCGNNSPQDEPSKDLYSITFCDESGNKLIDSSFEYGSTPYYNYEKQDTVEWDYTFKGWSTSLGGEVLNTLPSVSGTATYYAVIDAKKQQYTVFFNSNGGSEIASITAEYNSEIQQPLNPTKDGCSFVSWCLDSSLNSAVTWPLTLTSNTTLYAKWNEKVDIKSYLSSLLSALKQDPYSFIPNTMKPTNTYNHVSSSDVNYDFSNFTNVSSIKYCGFGQQWQMVIDNITESERFYSILTLADNLISASVVAFNNWFDRNPNDSNKSIEEKGYYAKVNFANGILTYTIQIKTGWNIPLFGEILPQIDMTYNIATKEKTVRINFSDNNAMRYVISDKSYMFGIEYGVDALNRSAFCEFIKTSSNSVEGHIYEYITLKGKDAVKSCADFYINDTYTSVVGNKASGIIGMDGYINELYKTSSGRLLGYKIKETKTVFGVSGTYHTLWFNLDCISGISSVKITDHTDDNKNSLNDNNVYVNGKNKLFTPTYNSKLVVRTSRKYDIELRTQYVYGANDGKLTCYKTNIPMMFIQDDHDGYTNYSDFVKDILADNGLVCSVTLSKEYLSKIRSDYDSLIPKFIQNKEIIDSVRIKAWIGQAIK